MSDTERSVLVGIAVVLAILFLFPTFLMGGMFPFGGMMGGWGGMMGGRAGPGTAAGWGWLWPLVFWGGIITAVVLLVRSAGRAGGGPAEGRETALDILKKRYARGEITRDEFEEKKRDLGL